MLRNVGHMVGSSMSFSTRDIIRSAEWEKKLYTPAVKHIEESLAVVLVLVVSLARVHGYFGPNLQNDI
jgi:hypothetical protein